MSSLGWFDPQRLPERVLALLCYAESLVVVSPASTWDLSIKHHQGEVPEQLVLVTADSQLSAFPFRRLWEG